MTSIYVAWYDITVPTEYLFYNKHLYLVKDPDSDTSAGNTSDEEIIRGGDGNNGDFRSGWSHFPGNPAPLLIESGLTSSASLDGVDSTVVSSTDYNEDGSPDTTVDRHYTMVDISSALALPQFSDADDGSYFSDFIRDYTTQQQCQEAV